MIAKRIVYNAKTGKLREEEFEFTPPPPTVVYGKGLDIEKLKKVLLEKGIIGDASEIE